MARLAPPREHRAAWYPGRLIGGAALVAGPPLWLAGHVLRYLALYGGTFTARQLDHYLHQTFAAPSQLAAYEARPGLVGAAYALLLAGVLVMFPAVLTVTRAVAVRSPALAYLGGTGLMLGLFARFYFAGVEQSAFRLTETAGPHRATEFVLGHYAQLSYGPWHLPVVAAACAYVGAACLAVGAFRSGVFGVVRLVLFLYSQAAEMGVLKSSTLGEMAMAGALCVVYVPFGLNVLLGRDARDDRPGWRRVW